MRPISRRTFLRGAAGAAIALPFLNVMQKRGRAASTFPKRFLIWFQPDGTIHENWVPTGSGTNFTLSRILQPLAPYQSQLCVVDGVYNHVGDYGEVRATITSAAWVPCSPACICSRDRSRADATPVRRPGSPAASRSIRPSPIRLAR